MGSDEYADVLFYDDVLENESQAQDEAKVDERTKTGLAQNFVIFNF